MSGVCLALHLATQAVCLASLCVSVAAMRANRRLRERVERRREKTASQWNPTR